jgi:hypothetical protein
MHAMDGGKHAVRFRPGAVEDLFEHLAGGRQAPKRPVASPRVGERADEVPRVDRANRKGALPIEKANGAFAVHPPQDRSGWEVAVVAGHPKNPRVIIFLRIGRRCLNIQAMNRNGQWWDDAVVYQI